MTKNNSSSSMSESRVGETKATLFPTRGIDGKGVEQSAPKNFGELFKKYDPVIKDDVRALLQRKTENAIKDLNMFKQEFDLVDKVYLKDHDIHRSSIRRDIVRKYAEISTYEDLGEGL